MKTKTTAIQRPCVPTLKDRTFVVVSEDMRVTEEYAQVFFHYHISKQCYNFITVSKLVIFFYFQPLPLAVHHLVVQTRSVKRVADVLFVIAMLVTRVTDTTVQVREISFFLQRFTCSSFF